MSERKESSSAYTRPAGGATSGTSSGTRDYLRVYFGSDITTGTMYGTMSTYYNSVQDFAENLEDFPDFGGGEQLRYLAPMSPGPESPAPASFTAPPQNQAFTAPPAIQPPGPVEGGEEESSTLGTVWYYAWEYGGEFLPLVGSGRGFKRAYDEGSTLGMAWNGFIFGVEATGVGAALGLIGKGGKAAVATSKVAAPGLRPMVSGMASAAKAKAVEAVTVAKSTVSDAVGAVGNKLDGLGERFAGLFWGGAKKVSDEVLSAPINGWKSSQTWNTAANSRILRKNMGALAKKGEEAHHIIQSTHPRAARAREILENYQIDINSAVNGVSLPPNGPRPSHRGQGLHSYSAIDRITDRLQLATEGIEDWAQARERVLEALDSIRAEILDGDFP